MLLLFIATIYKIYGSTVCVICLNSMKQHGVAISVNGVVCRHVVKTFVKNVKSKCRRKISSEGMRGCVGKIRIILPRKNSEFSACTYIGADLYPMLVHYPIAKYSRAIESRMWRFLIKHSKI